MILHSRRSMLALGLGSALALAGCGGDKKSSLDPPDVKYNEDTSEMGMFVIDPRYTAAYLPEDGDWILFDDIGELFRYRVMRFPENAIRVIWVNDYHDKAWVNAQEAWYVQSPEINSPMGWGLAAFRSEEAARQMQTDVGGEVMTWNDVLAQTWHAPPAPVTHEQHSPSPDSTPVR